MCPATVRFSKMMHSQGTKTFKLFAKDRLSDGESCVLTGDPEASNGESYFTDHTDSSG